MEIDEYQNIFEREGSHFFYLSTHNLAISLVKKYANCQKIGQLKILDAGCGTGLLSKKMAVFGKVWGIDISREALKFASKKKNCRWKIIF